MRLVAVNYHVVPFCNARCSFCFATFRDVSHVLGTDDALCVIRALQRAGAEKINFAGGEPTLRKDLGVLLEEAHRLGMTTSLVTNGIRLPELLDGQADVLHWVGLSVDSADEERQHALGRGTMGHVQRVVELATACRDLGVRVKLNTVVTSSTWDEDMSALIRAIQPERWKVFQVLPIRGQNSGKVEPLLLDSARFEAFVERHRQRLPPELHPIAEDNDAMRGSYAMVDPAGRFFGNATGTHVYSRPILEVGVEAALAEVGYRPEKLVARGGPYRW